MRIIRKILALFKADEDINHLKARLEILEKSAEGQHDEKSPPVQIDDEPAEHSMLSSMLVYAMVAGGVISGVAGNLLLKRASAETISGLYPAYHELTSIIDDAFKRKMSGVGQPKNVVRMRQRGPEKLEDPEPLADEDHPPEEPNNSPKG